MGVISVIDYQKENKRNILKQYKNIRNIYGCKNSNIVEPKIINDNIYHDTFIKELEWLSHDFNNERKIHIINARKLTKGGHL